jgi:CDP-diacylglycerol--serine O-phosphatidyltransferase
VLRFWNAANAITLLGLASALACALLSAHGLVPYAVVALVASGLCDFFDGFVARKLTRTDEEKKFGAALDSAVDACAFAIAPPCLLHAAGLTSPPELALLGFFTVCAVWRLAYFDTVGLASEGEQRYYTGLPTTFTALVLPLAFSAGFAGARELRIAANAAALFLALAMVSPWKVRKLGGPFYAIFALLAVAVSAAFVVFEKSFAVP